MTGVAMLEGGTEAGRGLPLYASYPTASQFRPGIGAETVDRWLAALPAGARLALHLHVPFCARICRFCCCRTQGAAGGAALAAYAAALRAEIARTAARTPAGATVAAIAWRGGSPTLFEPADVAAIDAALRTGFRVAAGADVRVEIEPEGIDEARLAAFREAGLATAQLGLQDFDPRVRRAIGRDAGPAAAAATAARLRRAGVAAVAVELLYGLPEQTWASAAASAAEAAAGIAPERVQLSGYVHAPWMAKRQRVIPEAGLPDAAARLAQFAAAAGRLEAAGYVAVGADLFARPGDALEAAAAGGRLRRDLLGYEARRFDAVIGFGAAAVSRLPLGLAQNAAETGVYLARIAAGGGAVARGRPLGLEDRVRGRAIEMLLCARRVDLAVLRAEFGDFAALVEPACDAAAARFAAVRRGPDGIALDPAGPLVARRVARLFDAYAGPALSSL